MTDQRTGIEITDQLPELVQPKSPEFSLARLKEKMGGRLQVMTFAGFLSAVSANVIAQGQSTDAEEAPEQISTVVTPELSEEITNISESSEQAEQLSEALTPMDYQWGYDVIGFEGDKNDPPPWITITPTQIERYVYSDLGLETSVSPFTEADFHRSLVHIEKGTMNSTYLHKLMVAHELHGLDYAVGGLNAVAGEYDANVPMALQRIIPEGEVPELAEEAKLERLEEIRMDEFFRAYAIEHQLPADPEEWPDEAFDEAVMAYEEASISTTDHGIARADLSIAWYKKSKKQHNEKQEEYRAQQAESQQIIDASLLRQAALDAERERLERKMVEEDKALLAAAKEEHGIK
ncbi:MAG: hypothetical protein ABW185_10835 [Sedimenticola sp.]